MDKRIDSMDLPTVPGYEYKPLISADAVRVVVLEPAASFESTLRCSLIQYSRSIELGLSDRQHYSAVSYTWGDEPASRQLLVTSNDLEHPEDTMLLIRPHVDSFLRHFRKAHKTVYLWVDAICLNQQDGVEKGQQIQLMGDIFKTAKKVHVWLGEDEGLGAKTFSVIRKLNLSGTDREGSQPKKTTLSPSDVDLLSGLLQKPWFTRRWVIQEIALARHAVLHWGESSLENSWLLSILPAMENSLDLYSARMLLTAREASIRPLGLLELLWRFDGSECGDRRDRVAALMGLVSASQRIAIDYNADDCKSIYARLATQLINESPASAQLTFVHLLAFGPVNVSDEDGSKRLSWVPNWGNQRIGHVQDSHDFKELERKIQELCGNRRTSSLSHGLQVKNEIMKFQWLDGRHGVYGRVVDRVYKLCESGTQCDVVKALQPLQDETFVISGFLQSTEESDESLYYARKNFGQLASLFIEVFTQNPVKSNPEATELMNEIGIALADAMERPSSLTPRQQQVIADIGNLLKKYSILSVESSSKNRRVELALGPHDVQKGDILIPLVHDPEQTADKTMTTACLRLITKTEDELKSYARSKDVNWGQISASKARILGPARFAYKYNRSAVRNPPLYPQIFQIV